MGELNADFASGTLHPGDLKPAVVLAINALLEPVRAHFAASNEAKNVLTNVRKYKYGGK
jgi:tyrosyl-tRNA synthetase